ncbi:hypothetical protein FOCG_18227 [Fusarium oxysporum f. sp. radicis-lycopersici 26381]|uniref:Uncharacterized protein n=1 Tax=Fusarium oxysporum NRRL 32931 TaxID=660029 RepID=W9HBP8_FUSOX|nr:hypothetical protein FOYG_16918 [Fusarium oxysporum NRRL 32931]EWZ78613.1 hypothetical protein FOWG_17182 [Fusarium oxysporum f. sp. lycopersici MN25]EXL39153.1 hypothetical protein FOCG_18227 [Fusarium oxysporum f. sp. radicis-lycopersici 26381]
MGTWCRIFIRYKGEFVIGQCGKGGYIDEQGVYLLNFLRSRRNILRLKKGLKHIEYTTDDEASEWKWKIDEKLRGNEALKNNWNSFCENVTGLPRELQEMNTSLHPCTGAAILQLISDSKAKQKVQLVKELQCTNRFDEDWHYVVDLDRSRLEVYHDLEPQHPDHMFFGHYRNESRVPRLNCAYNFGALEGLSEKKFVEYHEKTRKDGPTLESTRSLVQSFRIQKQGRLKKPTRTKRGKKEMLLRRLFTKRNGSGQKELVG